MKTIFTLLIAVVLNRGFGQEVTLIKMKSLNYKPIIEAEVNGKSALFLIDTGSDISIINSGEIKRFKLQELTGIRNKQAIGFNGEVSEVKKIKGAFLSLGEQLAHTTFYSLDIKELSESIQNKTGLRIMGIIGADILIKYNCIIDYRQKQVSLTAL